jgi:glutamate synthase domain-containing protein 2
MGSESAFSKFFDTIIERGIDSAPDFITLDGGEGGTGAAPMPLMDLVGVSIREALPRVSAMRNERGLKDRIRIVASGKLVNPGDIAWALCAGADFVTSARGFMFSLGCIQALKCNKNTCPTGITTHDPRFQKGLVPSEKYDKVAAYANGLIKEVETIAHSVGVSEPRKMCRDHVRIVQPDGTSIPLSTLYPG